MFVSRAHRWASKHLREVLSFFRPWGIFSKFLFCSAADVFFGRAASVETCECRARLTDRRDGAGRFARRPAAAQYERPVKSPAGFVARRLTGRGAARPSTRFRLCVLARVRTAAAASGAYCCFGVEREDCSWRLLLFLGLLYCQRARARLPVLHPEHGSKVVAARYNHLASRHTS